MKRVDQQAWAEMLGSFVQGLQWRCDMFRRDSAEAEKVAAWALEHGLTLDTLTNLVWVIAMPEVYMLQQGERQVMLALGEEPVRPDTEPDDLPF